VAPGEKKLFRAFWKTNETWKHMDTGRLTTVSATWLDAELLLPRRVDDARGSFQTKYFIPQSIPSFLKPPTVFHCSKEHTTFALAVTLPSAPTALGPTPSGHINSLCTSWGKEGNQLRVALTDGIATFLL